MYLDDEAKKAVLEGPVDSLASSVRRRLSGEDGTDGALEEAQRTADNCRAFLGGLTVLLVKRGLVRRKEVLEVLEGIDPFDWG